jgi:hypothetical protein
MHLNALSMVGCKVFCAKGIHLDRPGKYIKNKKPANLHLPVILFVNSFLAINFYFFRTYE